MTDKKHKRTYSADALFISLRTHFNFFRRFISYIFHFCGFFTNFFAILFKKLPFFNDFLSLLSHVLDSLAFGTNGNNPPISNKIAIFGYGTLLLLGAINLLITPLISPLLILAMSLTLGMYFESLTVMAWFTNYKTLEKQLSTDENIDQSLIDNALTMFNAALITFVSIALRAVALCLSISFPAAGLALFIVAQISEIGAILGSIGKEKVNISQNHDFWMNTEPCENDLVNHSYQYLNKVLKQPLSSLLYSSSMQDDPKSIDNKPIENPCLPTLATDDIEASYAYEATPMRF